MKHIWILFITITIVNGLVLKYRSRGYIARDPELAPGYEKLFRGWIFYGNIPWIIIAIGNLTGLTNNIFEYFQPRQMNPAVLIFHLSTIILWILLVKWIYFEKGAEFLERHPGLFRKSGFSNKDLSAGKIKFFLPLMLLGGVVSMIIMWRQVLNF